KHIEIVPLGRQRQPFYASAPTVLGKNSTFILLIRLKFVNYSRYTLKKSQFQKSFFPLSLRWSKLADNTFPLATGGGKQRK
ncbi:MAG: hypothetical protein LBR79_01310, partial [Oscillospiraceae bacterium]|nr:hypothetical protein [Oscillospiraceae bacterium]